MITKTELIKTSPFFAGLSPAELESIVAIVIEKKYERDDMLFYEGEEADALYFIADGVVKIFKTSVEGKEQILSIAHAGESINEVPVFNGGINPTSAQSMMPVVIYAINRNDIEKILKNNHVIALNVIHAMAKRTRQLVTLVEELSFKRVIGRLAGILLDNATNEGDTGAKLTQRDMAAMAGTAREVVSRSLKSMENDGLIVFDKHRLIIKNREALKKMSGSFV